MLSEIVLPTYVERGRWLNTYSQVHTAYLLYEAGMTFGVSTYKVEPPARRGRKSDIKRIGAQGERMYVCMYVGTPGRAGNLVNRVGLPYGGV